MLGRSIKYLITRILLPASITVVILSFLFRQVTLSDLKLAFNRIPVTTIIVFMIFSLIATYLRCIKYAILISHKINRFHLFLITLVRNCVVDLLPARSGALLLYSYLTRKKGLPLEEGTSSFTISVFYDGLAMAVMLTPMALFLKVDQIPRLPLLIAVALVYFISLGFLLGVHPLINWIKSFGWIHRFTALDKIISNISDYLQVHKSPREGVFIFALSLAIRGIKYLTLFMIFQGITGINFELSYLFLFCLGLAATELSSLLPIQGLGGFGTWELAFTLIFKGLAMPIEDPFLTGFLIHIITQTWEYFLGLSAFIILNWRQK